MYFTMSIDMAFCFCQAIYARNRITDKKELGNVCSEIYFFSVEKSKDLALKFFDNISINNWF